mgnify:FL=1
MAQATALPRPDGDLALRWSGRVSLTTRILAVNVFALAMLAGGFFYLDSFRTRLIDQRLEMAAHDAQAIAMAIGGQPAAERGQMLRRFGSLTGARIRIYGADGTLVEDSWRLGGPSYRLRDPRVEPWQRHVARFLDRAAERIVGAERIDRFAEPARDRAEAWPEIGQLRAGRGRPLVRTDREACALCGPAATRVRAAPDRTLMISAAAPVDRGWLLLTNNARDITRTLRAERFRLGIVLLAVALSSVLLSLFLARTIVRPLRRLASAAIRVRLGRAREVMVPRLPDRRDEIGSLARAVSDMSQALRERIDATDAFAADVTHELKNPLASLRSAVDALERVQAEEQRLQLLAIIGDDVRRLDRLITDIAEASRLDAELSRARFEPVDLGLTVEKMLQARETRGPSARGVQIAFARPRRGVAVVMGDESRLVRVLENLLDNALSFSPDGGLVEIVATRIGDDVVVRVEDQGPGVPPELRDDIFRRFHSVRPAGEGFGEHSGLGLAIAKAIVEGHLGQIDVETRDMRPDGAAFVIRLPAATPEPVPA